MGMQIESELFDWEIQLEVSLDCLMFESCTLKQDIGKYKKGMQIHCIALDFDTSKIKIFGPDSEEPLAVYELELKIGKELDE